MSMTAAERNKATAYAGPHHSFPEYSSGEHLRAAWDLAGHSADPAATRARIKRFARKHGLTGMLPKTAKAMNAPGMDYDSNDGDWDDDNVDSAEDTTAHNPVLSVLAGKRSRSDGSVPVQTSQPTGQAGSGAPSTRLAGTLVPGPAEKTGRAPKEGRRVTQDSTASGFAGPNVPPATMKGAQASRLKQLVQTAYDAAESADGQYSGGQRERVIGFAQDNGLTHHLPERAHGFMHSRGMPHTHQGTPDGNHMHTVKKAVNVVAKSVTIEKAWGDEDGTCHIEGWVSTEDADSEHDVVPPEAFRAALPDYAKRRMPLSSEHAMKALPIGHGQHIALVRDGHMFAEATHPTDAADFEHFPGVGTGVYGRYVITDPVHAAQVLKGNIGGFSWVGNLREYEPLPGGGRRFLPDSIQPWLESTVAAYPVNGKAVLLAAKAYEDALGVQAPAQESPAMDDTLEALLQGALEAMQREEAATTPVAEVTKAQLEKMFAGLGEKLDSIVEAKVAKATSEVAKASREGVGRAGTVAVAPEDEREADPGKYIVKASRAAVKAGEELSDEDKALAWGIFHTFVASGMKED